MAGWMLAAVAAGYTYYLIKYFRNLMLQKSRSLAVRGLVLFFALPWSLCAVGLVSGFLRGNAARAQWEREQELASEMDGTRIGYSGTVEQLRDHGETWEVVLRGDEEKENVRRLLVYVDKGSLKEESVETETGDKNAKLVGNVVVGETAVTDVVRPRIGGSMRVEGKVQAFEGARNPGQFDFKNYYRSQKLSYRMSADRCSLQEPLRLGWRGQLRDGLWEVAERAGQILDFIAGPQDAGIFKAAILGDKTGLDAEVKDLYQRNGIAHLLAISALHLSLISMAVYSSLRRIGLGFAGAGMAGGIFLIAFAVMTGMSPSIVRALVMALCGYLAAYLGRTYDLLSALSLSACLILWDSPYQLTQAGVQLSYAAVLGIAAVAPLLQKRGLSQAMSVSIGMQLMSLPIILYHYFQIPLYSIFLNLIVVPFMGIVIASGSAGIILGSRSLRAGKFAIAGGHYVLRLYEFLCTIWQRLPGSNIILGQPKLWQIGVYYGMLGIWMVWMYFEKTEEKAEESEWNETGSENMDRRKKVISYAENSGQRGGMPDKRAGDCCDKAEDRATMIRIMRSVRLIIPVVVMLVVLLPHPTCGLQVTVIDVGQGDGICLRTRAGTVLVDGGSTSEKTLGEDILEPYLKSQAIRIIDYAIVSHGDLDHISGLQYLLEEGQDIRIRHLVLPAAGRGDEVYDRLSQLAMENGADVIWLGTGDELTVGNLRLNCIYPGSAVQSADDTWQPLTSERNDHSLVITASYGNFRMLLTGDMSAEGEQELVKQCQTQVQIPLNVLSETENYESGKKEEATGKKKETQREIQTVKELENITVLKVAHHGSRYSTTADFLSCIRPQTAVISCAKHNSYGHPSGETLNRLDEADIPYKITMDCGAITITTDGKTYQTNAFLDP
jgi:competence protein ComEC